MPAGATAVMSTRCPHQGVVEMFDDERGLGTVTTAGGISLPFHCTAIVDGTRQIDAGTAVAFVVVAGSGGRLEAGGLVPGGG